MPARLEAEQIIEDFENYFEASDYMEQLEEAHALLFASENFCTTDPEGRKAILLRYRVLMDFLRRIEERVQVLKLD